MTATGLREDATARQAVPPEVMASLDDYARTILRTGHAGDLENARNKHLAAIAAAIEAARRPDTDSMSYRAKPEPFIG